MTLDQKRDLVKGRPLAAALAVVLGTWFASVLLVFTPGLRACWVVFWCLAVLFLGAHLRQCSWSAFSLGLRSSGKFDQVDKCDLIHLSCAASRLNILFTTTTPSPGSCASATLSPLGDTWIAGLRTIPWTMFCGGSALAELPQ